MPTIKKYTNGKVVALRGDVESLRDDILNLTSSLESLLGDQVKRTRHTAHDLSDQLGDELASAKSWVRKTVTKRPRQAGVVALGLGVLAGLIFFRRD